MKQILIIGWPNQDGSGTPVVIGPPTSEKEKRELGQIISDAKKLQKFPKGLKFIAYGIFESQDLAIFISEKSAATLQNADKARRDREELKAELDRAELAVIETRKAIPKAKSALAVARDAVTVAKQRLATEEKDDARYDGLLKSAKDESEKIRLKKLIEIESKQTAEAKAALESANAKATAAEEALKTAESEHQKAVATLNKLKPETK